MLNERWLKLAGVESINEVTFTVDQGSGSTFLGDYTELWTARKLAEDAGKSVTMPDGSAFI